MPGGPAVSQERWAQLAREWFPELADARLRDVTFVDGQQGWAVGDRGVIWHTTDGGRRWELQTSGVDCPLSAVEFIDARHGWAGGRGPSFPTAAASPGPCRR